ncbi:MAG TPA: molybdopterin-dependent oxidoreductase [Chloroflexia bacterium]|nr:molybdopterin-dependent oxidoreductase [Chloroflexia bacterium]
METIEMPGKVEDPEMPERPERQEIPESFERSENLPMPEKSRLATLRGGFGAGVGAALVMILVMAVLRFTTNTISIPELVEEKLTNLAGGQIESFFIGLFQEGGKALLLVLILEGTLLLGGLLGFAFTKLWPAWRNMGANRWLSGLLYGLIVGAGLNVIVLPLFGHGFFGSNALQATAPQEISRTIWGSTLAPFGIPVALNMFLLSIVFGLTLAKLLRWPRTVETEGPVAVGVVEGPDQQRRSLMRVLGGGTLAVVGGGALWGVLTAILKGPQKAALVETDLGANPTPQPGATAVANQPTPVPGQEFTGVKALLVPDITPTESFYITTKNYVDPTVDGAAWSLTFKGLVDNPYSITLKELTAMQPMDRIETLACISNPIGGSLIGNAKWKGVDFGEMVKKAKPRNEATEIIVRGADGYTDSFPLTAALENQCVLVYEMNGAPLTLKHGYPARLLVPGIYGMKNCKWITEVELANYDYKGYWESQGWSDTAPYMTMSRIDFPDKDNIEAKPVYISGVAFAGDRRIQRVEVSTDGGQTWTDARLRTPLSEFAWVQWTFPWNPKSGTYDIKVRATDGKGEVQTAREQGTYPDGATGYHTKRVHVM